MIIWNTEDMSGGDTAVLDNDGMVNSIAFAKVENRTAILTHTRGRGVLKWTTVV